MSASTYTKKFKSYFPPRKSYVGVGKLKDFIELNQYNGEIKVVTLILLRKFIDTDFSTVILNDKKVPRQAKLKELKHGKIFWNDFIQEIA